MWRLTGDAQGVDRYDVFWENADILDSVLGAAKKARETRDLSIAIGNQLEPLLRAIVSR